MVWSRFVGSRLKTIYGGYEFKSVAFCDNNVNIIWKNTEIIEHVHGKYFLCSFDETISCKNMKIRFRHFENKGVLALSIG